MEVDVPLSVAWELWSDKEGVNRWMPWIASVKVPNTYPFSTMFFLFLISILYTIQARTKITADSFYFILEMDEIKEVRLTDSIESFIEYSI